MPGRDLRRVLGSIVNVVIAGSVGAASAAACKGSSGEPVDDEETFACEAPLPDLLSNLTPAAPVDYVELREATFARDADGGSTAPTYTTKASHGSACATASDRATCVAALGAATLREANEGWLTDGDILAGSIGRSAAKEFLVYTRGDEVGVARTTEEVASFLGPIDTREEARLILQTRNLILACTTTPAQSGWRKNDDGSWEFLVAGHGCGPLAHPYRVRVNVSAAGTVSNLKRDTLGDSGVVCGRRPRGLCALDAAKGSSSVGDHFARCAHLEAASVVAFRRLELELLRFGAPPSLVARARRSRADEIRHARETSRIARRFGAVVPPVVVGPMSTRDLFSIALENVVEGCVRETYGALVAAFQARIAAPELRPMLARIALDEARHAELAHDVARFLDRKLTPAERARIDRARRDALADLRSELHDPPRDLVDTAGLPSRAQALALLDGLEHHALAA
ncbi:MAG: ferritin-like domain-containing protein [Labilithrix sp.]|nr:ferritin-like domain-containing protein [Labilithrix sp.]